MSREAEIDQLGWDSWHIILVTGDALPTIRASAWRFRTVCWSSGLPRGDHRPAGLEQQRRLYASGQTEPVLRRHRWQIWTSMI